MAQNHQTAPDAIENLRRHRSRPEFDTSITRVLQSMASEAERTERRLGDLITCWNEVVPDSLGRQTQVTSLQRGTLHVTVSSASVRYELDRMLREGMLDRIRSRYRGSLQRVKLVVAG